MKGIGDLSDRGCHEKEASKARTPHLQTYQAAVPQAAKAFHLCPNLPTFPLPALALSAVLFVGLLLKNSLHRASETHMNGLERLSPKHRVAFHGRSASRPPPNGPQLPLIPIFPNPKTEQIRNNRQFRPDPKGRGCRYRKRASSKPARGIKSADFDQRGRWSVIRGTDESRSVGKAGRPDDCFEDNPSAWHGCFCWPLV